MSEALAANSNISHYRILKKIGAGGMGEVYLAEDTRLDRKVALKILPTEFAEDKERMSRFVREAKSASALNHPNIITIHEIGAEGGTHFIATEFIDGKTLREYAKSNPPDFKSALEIAIQIASALDEAHSAGIVHRDIKPDNVMIRPNGLVKILDFGIAKLSNNHPPGFDEEAATAIKPQTTSPGMIIGTANYMSPEQANGKEIDARSDIFSFGVVLYEMIAGSLPFKGGTPIETIGAILHKEPKPLKAEVPHEIKRIIGKCLKKDASERYQAIKDVWIELKEVKQNLEFQEKSDRSVVANQDQTKTQILSTTDETNKTPANKAGSGNQTKKYFAVGLAILLILAIGFGYWFFTRSGKQIESIAVLPFVNESGNAEVEYLSDGMTETLISSLSNIPNLSVKARSTVFYYKGKEASPKKIGEELSVQTVLLGRVFQRGDDLRLNLELVNTETQDIIWSESYNRKQGDLVSLQSEIARDVLSKLKTKLSGTEEARVTKSYTENAEAYQLYLKGRFYWNKRTAENLKKAIEQFREAANIDPNYAFAYVGLADCYVLLEQYAGTPSNETIPQAKAFATRALQIDESLAEAHASLGLINYYLWQWSEAEKEFERAIELNPNYATVHQWYSLYLRYMGRFDESLAEIKRAQELDPLSLIIISNIGQVYSMKGDTNTAIEQYKKALELDPNYPTAHTELGNVYRSQGRYAEALAEAQKAVELSARASRDLGFLGYTFAVLGKRREALAIVKELEEKYAKRESIGYNIALVHIGLGEIDQAILWLEKDFKTNSGQLIRTKWEPEFESLRDDPRFQDLLRRMGLPL